MIDKEGDEKSTEDRSSLEGGLSAVTPDSQSATLPGNENSPQTGVTPESIKAYLQATWFWQVLGVCAMQKLWTKFLVAVLIMAGIGAFRSSLELLTPIYRLDEMNRTEGVLMKVASKGRNAYKKRIIIRKDNGEQVIFRGTIRSEHTLMKAAIGKQVAVWSQVQYDFIPPFLYERFWHIQEGEKILINYGGYFPVRLKVNSHFEPALLKFFLFMFFVPLIIILIVCQRGTKKA